MALPRAIIDLEDYTESQNWCIYGPTGAGKTPFATGHPKTLILAVDNQGTISAQRAGRRSKVWPITSWLEFEVAYKWLKLHQKTFDWVVIDTVSMLQTRLMRHILETEYKRNRAKRRNEYIPEIQDHQMWQNVLKRYVMDLNEMAFNTVWTAQQMERENAEGDVEVWPLLPGGKQGYEMAAWLVAQMHVIGHLGVKRSKGSVQRRLLLRDAPPYLARDRYGVLPKSAVVMEGDAVKLQLSQLTAMINKAPASVRQRAAKRIEERDDTAEIDPPARPKRTTRRTKRAS